MLTSKTKIGNQKEYENQKKFAEPLIHKTLQDFTKTRKNRNGSVVMNVMRVTIFIYRSDFGNLQLRQDRT